MIFTVFQTIMIVVLVVSGTGSIMGSKWADKIKAKGKDGTERHFHHMLTQCNLMFLAMALCAPVFLIVQAVDMLRRKRNPEAAESKILRGKKRFNYFIFLPPAIIEVLASSFLFLAIIFTDPGSFQMIRGCGLFFAAILSMAFLKRVLKVQHWFGIAMVIIGLLIVGYADYSSTDKKTHDLYLLGDAAIVVGQFLFSVQYVYEEKFINKHDVPPLLAIGVEGSWGFLVTLFLYIPLNFIKVPKPYQDNPNGTIEDIVDAYVQFKNSWLLVIAVAIASISVAFLNYSGITITKELSATTRVVLDTIRTFTIWVLGIGLKWQKYQHLHSLGFLILTFGMLVYNEIIEFVCCKNKVETKQPAEPEPDVDKPKPDLK